MASYRNKKTTNYFEALRKYKQSQSPYGNVKDLKMIGIGTTKTQNKNAHHQLRKFFQAPAPVANFKPTQQEEGHVFTISNIKLYIRVHPTTIRRFQPQVWPQNQTTWGVIVTKKSLKRI